MSARQVWVVIALALAAGLATAREGDRVEAISASTLELPGALSSAVEPSGWRAVRADGSIAVELWLARDLGELEEGRFVGIARLGTPGQDVRGRVLPPGVYTLRSTQVPPSDRHGGCLRHPLFLVLARAADHLEPEARLSFFEMTTLSASVSGGRHPAAWQAQRGRGGSASRAAEPGFSSAGSDEILTLPAFLRAGRAALAIFVRGSLSR